MEINNNLMMSRNKNENPFKEDSSLFIKIKISI